VFNLLPGQGLGFTGSKEIAFGLGAVIVQEIEESPGGGFRFVDYSYKRKKSKPQTIKRRVIDNAYSHSPEDDEEIREILWALFEVIGNE
jgi:hypothetical protein